MKVAVVKETFPGERRVALVPANLAKLAKAGFHVQIEKRAGEAAGFLDAAYEDKGAQLVSREDAFAADLVLQVRALGANKQAGRDDLPRLRAGQLVVGLCDPLGEPQAAAELAAKKVTLFALELMPRTTRAQMMDVLSSMATISGYEAALLGAINLPKLFPMLMTAAGTLAAAKVLVIGAGVAGLKAIATAKRLGAIVRAYDVRPACREQVESLGAKFVELPLAAGDAQDQAGYARQQGEEFLRNQRELLGRVVAESDVVITTALVPGKPSPQLINAKAVAAMQPGSVIIDLAAERGGNCALTRPDQRVVEHGVTILGPTNLPSEAAHHASQLFSGNVTAFLLHLIKDGKLNLNRDDAIIRETLVAEDGQVVADKIRGLLANA